MSGFTPSECGRDGRRAMLKSIAAGFCLTLFPGDAGAAGDDGVSRTAESIHQEITFAAPPRRVYAALTDASQFQKIEELGAGMGGLDVRSHPAEISRMAGGAFSLFGGYIVGRQIELVEDQRIVQAWRVGGWAPGIFSVARFQLTSSGEGTRLTFDHIGFPPGTAEHLAAGWHSHYWEPMTKYLG